MVKVKDSRYAILYPNYPEMRASWAGLGISLTECKARTRFEIDFVFIFLILRLHEGCLLLALNAICKYRLFERYLLVICIALAMYWQVLQC